MQAHAAGLSTREQSVPLRMHTTLKRGLHTTRRGLHGGCGQRPALPDGSTPMRCPCACMHGRPCGAGAWYRGVPLLSWRRLCSRPPPHARPEFCLRVAPRPPLEGSPALSLRCPQVFVVGAFRLTLPQLIAASLVPFITHRTLYSCQRLNV